MNKNILEIIQNSNFEMKTIEEISKKISSGGTPKTGIKEYYNGEIPWLRTQEVNFGEIWKTGVKITEAGVANSSAKWIPANCVIVAMYGATVGKIGINKIPMTTNQACCNIEIDETIADYRYVFHFLMMQYEYIRSLGTGSQTNINAQIVKNLEIPIPPLEIQQKVVEILDKMTDYVTELTAELTAELTLRQKQYSYYRDQLLTFPSQSDLDKSIGVEWKTLGEIAEYSKLRISAAELTEENYVGVDNLLQNRQGKTLSKHVPSEGNLTKFQSNDILIGNIRPYLKKIWLSNLTGGSNGDVLVIRTTSDDVNPNYLYQVLSDDRFFNYDMKNSKGAKMPRGNKEAILKYKIPLPNLTEQKRIVEILDKFDKLTSDLSEGLPREIKLRQKQYEYWREQLLSFKKE
ncbi:restriction endonuclease subunit S [Lactococcus garvieae]|uniref:restriction endonuclease subunit S n=1 Tax=Lactococcus garvieae TaxID=1363 RepID=UPI0011500FC4|nr:restriction endonuclease subunit S [Lactococcus garvieae]